MITSKHTPGPWSYVFTEADDYVVIWADDADVNIGHAFPFMRAHGPLPVEANARLMAAAPDMLTMLRHSRDAIASLSVEALGMGNAGGMSDPYPIRDELLANIDTAIAKAEGQS